MSRKKVIKVSESTEFTRRLRNALDMADYTDIVTTSTVLKLCDCLDRLTTENERLKERLKFYDNKPVAMTCPKCNTTFRYF